MLTSNNFNTYQLIDAGEKEKLELWDDIKLRRPDPMAIWPKNPNINWDNIDAFYHRSNKGGGSWEYRRRLPEMWTVNYRELKFKVSPTGFKHTGIFPEQAANWDFVYETIKASKKDVRVLNLFAYTGAATMVASAAGASEVVHVDASKGMVEWAKENRDLSGLENNHIRFIVDDCLKFIQREIRRGRKYEGIIMDPPSYGRGPNNEVFHFEDQINPLIEGCLQLLSDDALFFIINTYTTGYSPTVMINTLKRQADKIGLEGNIMSDEIGIKIKNSNEVLPCGQTTRWTR